MDLSQLKQQALDLAVKLKLVKDDGKLKPAAAPKAVKSGAKPVAKPGAKSATKPDAPKSQKFDFNLFIEATKRFWNRFLKEDIPNFFKNPAPYFENYISWFKALKNDEKATHVAVYVGSLLMVLGLVFLLV